jgi:hypothetical protein
MKKLVFSLVILSFLACKKSALETDGLAKKSELEKFQWLEKNKDHVNEITLHQFQQLDAKFQRVLFNTVTAEKRASLWKDKLSLAASSESNSAKRAFLEEVIRVISPEFYSENNDRLRQKMQSLERKSLILFSIGEVKNLFTTLERQPEIVNSDTQVNSEGETDVIEDDMSAKPDCQCSREPYQDYCSTGKYCQNSSSCKKTTWGCGWMLYYDCTGYCSGTYSN